MFYELTKIFIRHVLFTGGQQDIIQTLAHQQRDKINFVRVKVQSNCAIYARLSIRLNFVKIHLQRKLGSILLF